MSYLLALCEQFRLQRKISTLTAKQIRASHRKERMTKQIERVQKMYQKRHQKIQHMAELMQKQFQVGIQNKFGLGTQQGYWNFSSGGLSNFVVNAASSIFNSFEGVKKRNADGSESNDWAIAPLENKRFNEMLQEYRMNGGIKPNYKEGSTTEIESYGNGQYSEDEMKVFQMAMQGGQQYESQARMQMDNMMQQYSNNINIWQQAAEAELDAQEDTEVMPLQEQELEWDLEQQSADTQLADARERLERIKQLVQDGTKNNAPSFGLG